MSERADKVLEGLRLLRTTGAVLRVLQVLRVRALPVLLLALSACVQAPERVRLPGTVARSHVPSSIRVQVRDGGAAVVREVPLEEYVAATALSEVHPEAGDDAIAERIFELQAIIARTYAVSRVGRHAKDGFDLCSTTHCQLYEPARLKTSRWAAAAQQAAARTSGELLWYGGAPALALFHADCGGHTSDATAVWGGAGAPYLTAAPDDCAAGHTAWTFETRANALKAALDADPRTDVGASLDRVEVAGRDAAGRAELILLRGERTFIVRGEVFREVVTRALGARSLKSTMFAIDQTRDRLLFSGRGFGHGVGLCQAGALARLRTGASPADVLGHYFPGTVVR